VHYCISPLLTPNEKLHIKSEFLIDLKAYILGESGINSDNFQQNFGANSAQFQPNFEKISGKFQKNSGNIQNPTATDSVTVHTEIDLLLQKIREESAKVRGLTKSKKTKSAIKANMLELEAMQWHKRGDMEEMQAVYKSIKGLKGSINNVKTNAETGRTRKKRRPYYIALGVLGILIFVIVPAYYTARYYYRKAYPKQAPTLVTVQEPSKYTAEQINEMISIFEQENGIRIFEKRRTKIIELINQMPNTQPVTIIDSISIADWHSL